MTKTKKTVLITIVSTLKLIINSVITLILGRIVLKYLGSDYNGINTTINQIVSILSILEGDYSTASLTALFKPLKNKDINQINGILSYSNSAFKKISVLMSAFASILVMLYVPTIITNINKIIVYLLFAISIACSIINVGLTNKYYLLIKAEQKEYVSTLIELVISTFFKLLSAVVLVKTHNVILYRIPYLIEAIVLWAALSLYVRMNYKSITFNSEEKVKVSGTKDLFVSKIVSAVYSSSTTLFLSSFSGTLFTSVYHVYSSIINIIKQVIYVVINAPINAFGSLFVEKKYSEVYDIFIQYEFLIMLVIFSVIPSAGLMSQPFVRLYTSGVSDINYINSYLPIILSLIAVIELIHIPSGICINMTRQFAVAKKIQTITCFCLIMSNLIGFVFGGFYGILIGTLLSNLVLAIMEITYTRIKIFNKSLLFFWKNLIINLIVTIPVFFENMVIIGKINDYVSFFAYGIIIFVINALVIVIVNYMFNRVYLGKIYSRFKEMLIKTSIKV